MQAQEKRGISPSEDDSASKRHEMRDKQTMNEELLLAVKNADQDNDVTLKNVQELLSAGADPNTKDSLDHKTCLHYAVKNWSGNAYTNIVRMLLSAGAAPDVACEKGNTPLLLAADLHEENPSLIEDLISAGADVNKANLEGETSIFLASSRGYKEIVRALLSAGACPDAAEKQGLTPLMIASCTGDSCECMNERKLDIVRQLIDDGANVNAADEEGETSLLKACKHGNLKMFDLLLSGGASITSADIYGQNILFHATRSGNIALVKRTIDLGLDVNYDNGKNSFDIDERIPNTALHIAVQNNDFNMSKFLIAQGADPNLLPKNSTSWSPISLDPHLLKLLLSHGADMYVNLANSSISLLGHIVFWGNVSALRVLLEHGLDLRRYNPQTPDDFSPLHAAIKNNNSIAMLSILLEYNKSDSLSLEHENNFNETPLIAAIKSMSLDCVKILLDSGVEVNRANRDGLTPLVIALIGLMNRHCAHKIKKGFSILKLLLSRGADMYWCGPNNSESILEGFIKWNRIAEMRLFLEHGFDLSRYNPRSPSDFSPLHESIKRKDFFDEAMEREDSIVMLSLLLEFNSKHSLDLGHENEEGEPPLHFAVLSKFPDAVKLLVESGANVNQVDSNGRSPLELTLRSISIWYRYEQNISIWYRCEQSAQILVESGAKLGDILLKHLYAQQILFRESSMNEVYH